MKKMKRVQKTLALMLSIVVVCSCLMAVPVSAAENTAAEDDTSFVYCSPLLKFDEAVTENVTFATNTKYFNDVFTCITNNVVNDVGAWNYIMQDGAVEFHAQASGGKQARLRFAVDLTKDHVMNWEVSTTSNNRAYALRDADNKNIDPDSNGSYDGGYSVSALLYNDKTKPAYYTIVVDASEDGSGADLHFYKDNTYVCTRTYTGESVNLLHFLYTATGANTDVHIKMYYFADYALPETPAFQIVGKPTATEAVIQFNTPVDSDSLTGITAGGNVATATNVSADYDEPNVYKLTYAELADNATHQIAVTGATGLKDSTGAATALTMEPQSFTLGVLKDPNEMSMYTLYGFDNEPMDTDGVLADNPMGWSIIRNSSGITYNYDGNGALLLNIPSDQKNVKSQMRFNIDLTKDMIYDYRVYVPLWVGYGIDTTDNTTMNSVGSGGLSDGAMSTKSDSTGLVTNRYTIMVDTTGKTVKYYLNGVLKVTETFTEEETVKAYNHYIMDTGTIGGAVKLYYYAEYEAAENAKIKVVDVPAANQVVVQFNQPVSLAELTEGLSVTNAEGSAAVSAITAADVSSNYECPNTYKLTYETLPVGNYTVAANVKGLSDAATTTNFGTAAFEVEAFTAEVATNGTESYVQANRALELTSEDGETVSTATAEADGKTYTVGMVALPKSYGENCYQINTVSLPAGDYTVTATPVAVDGNTLTNPLTYSLTVTGEALAVGTPAIADGVLTVNATNNRNANQTFIVILAEYATDANGDVLMTQVAVDTVTAKAFAGEETHTMSLTPSAAAEGVTYTFRAFVWDNLTSMANLIDVE